MRHFINFCRRLFQQSGGSVTVEFVAMTPVLLTAFIFSYEFGRGLLAYDVMTRDVRAASRYLARANTADPTTGSFKTNAQKIIETGLPNGTTKHFPWTEGTATFSFTSQAVSSDFNTFQAGSVIKISASLPITLGLLANIPGLNLTTNYTLTASDEARHIGD